MVPDSALSVLFFLALVSPGLVFELLWERRKFRPDESAFREISRVVLASFVFSVTALVALALIDLLIRTITPGHWRALPNLDDWLGDGVAYVKKDHWRVGALLVLWPLLASGLAWLTYRRFTHGEETRLSHVSAWWQAFRQRNPTTAAPQVRVRLKSGVTYVGRLGDYTASAAPVAEREIVLYPPLLSKLGGTTLSPIPSHWHAVILHGSEIESIAVEYREPLPGEPSNWE